MEKQAVSSTISGEHIAHAKSLGCLRDKTTADCFNCRVITGNGRVTNSQMQTITKAAELFGDGNMAFTVRLTVEIQRVAYDNIEPLRAFLQEHGLDIGGTGPKVRPVVSCKGTTCHFGLIDTYALSSEIHKRFYLGMGDVVLPHKFKIAVGGCPNNCVKPDLNDVGIVGQRIPMVDNTLCKGCKKCGVISACPVDAAHLVQGTIAIDESKCIHCGRCVSACPFHVTDESVVRYKMYIGGRWGKKCAQGQPVSQLLLTQNQVLDTIERVILFYRDNGLPKERFADTITRLGLDVVEQAILSN